MRGRGWRVEGEAGSVRGVTTIKQRAAALPARRRWDHGGQDNPCHLLLYWSHQRLGKKRASEAGQLNCKAGGKVRPTS